VTYQPSKGGITYFAFKLEEVLQVCIAAYGKCKKEAAIVVIESIPGID